VRSRNFRELPLLVAKAREVQKAILKEMKMRRKEARVMKMKKGMKMKMMILRNMEKRIWMVKIKMTMTRLKNTGRRMIKPMMRRRIHQRLMRCLKMKRMKRRIEIRLKFHLI
jgi:hypothetical protein